MKWICQTGAGLAMCTAFLFGSDAGLSQPISTGPFAGWATNGPAVYRSYVQTIHAEPGPMVSYNLPPTNLPPDVRRALMTFRMAQNVIFITNTTRQFDHFVAESLNNLVWTNFIAHTNGKSMAVWSERTRTRDWPVKPAHVRWNPKSLTWGMKGLTALSPCWEGEGAPGGAPITLLTPRHGYTRGHSMGPDRFSTDFAGKRVWFLTVDNTIVERKILRQVVRTREVSHRDYTLFLFDSDLPRSIQPMRVVHANDVFGAPTKYCLCPGAPALLFKTEQNGNVSADVPGFTLDTMKMGDSGSPNMVPLPGELVFWNGRTTSSVSPEMQADMDELCRTEGLDPAKYQLQYVDLSAYPTYRPY